MLLQGLYHQLYQNLLKHAFLIMLHAYADFLKHILPYKDGKLIDDQVYLRIEKYIFSMS